MSSKTELYALYRFKGCGVRESARKAEFSCGVPPTNAREYFKEAREVLEMDTSRDELAARLARCTKQLDHYKQQRRRLERLMKGVELAEKAGR